MLSSHWLHYPHNILFYLKDIYVYLMAQYIFTVIPGDKLRRTELTAADEIEMFLYHAPLLTYFYVWHLQTCK